MSEEESKDTKNEEGAGEGAKDESTGGCLCCKDPGALNKPSDLEQRELNCDVTDENRSCHDVYCIIIYAIFMVVWMAIAYIAFTNGDAQRLYYGVDHEGCTCGSTNSKIEGCNDLEDKQRLYYPRLNEDLLAFAMEIGQSADSIDFTSLGMDQLNKLNLTGVCVEECPGQGEVVCTEGYYDSAGEDGYVEPTAENVDKCKSGASVLGFGTLYALQNPVLCESCWFVPINTTEIFFRCFEIIFKLETTTETCLYPKGQCLTSVDANGEARSCEPRLSLKSDDGSNSDCDDGDMCEAISGDDERCITKNVEVVTESEQPAYNNPLGEFMGEALRSIQGYMADIAKSLPIILIFGVVGAILLGFIYIFFLRFCTDLIVWGTIVLIILMLFFATLWSFLMSGIFEVEFLSEYAELLGLEDVLPDPDPSATLVNLSSDVLSAELSAATGMDSMEIAVSSEKLWKASAFSLSVVDIAVVVVVIALAKKIRVAIAIIEEATVAIMYMPMLVFYPFVTTVLVLVIFLWFAAVGGLLVSLDSLTAGDLHNLATDALDLECNVTETLMTNSSSLVSTETSYSYGNYSISFSDLTSSACDLMNYAQGYSDFNAKKGLLWVHLFCFLWTNQFFMAVGCCVISGAICDWYWTRPSRPHKKKKEKEGEEGGEEKAEEGGEEKAEASDDDESSTASATRGGDGEELQFPILASIYRTVRYHLGSLLVGAAIVAIVQLIRIIMAYIQKQTSALKDKSGFLKMVFKVINCCMCLLERCLKFVTKNAYIMIAMKGHGFCDSCCHAFRLLLSNLAQFALVSVFSKVIMMLGKLFILTACAVGTYFFVVFLSEAELNNVFIPVLFVCLIAYFTASSFLSVYDLAIGTILLCFCEDYKVHNLDNAGDPLHEEVYMPQSLRKIVLDSKTLEKMPAPLTKEDVLQRMGGKDVKKERRDAIKAKKKGNKQPESSSSGASVAPEGSQEDSDAVSAVTPQDNIRESSSARML